MATATGKKRVIAIFTGNRAEYGLQFPVIRAVKNHPDLDYRLIVSGAHLTDDFGRTMSEIEKDGLQAHAEVKIDLGADDLIATAQAIGTGIVSMSEALSKIKPDLLVVYADRFESFAAVIAGTQMGIPTAHIEGGDITEGGALDDTVRHAMTKLAHLHFTTNEQATNRLLAMGEEEWRVHTAGFPAIDMIVDGHVTSREDLVKRYNLDLSRPVIVFTQHSVTTLYDQAAEQLMPSLEALKKLAAEGVQVIMTYPNNDAGGRRIYGELEEMIRLHGHNNIQLHRSLGRANYHGLLALAQDRDLRVACVGNSSSGIKETPVFGCPTVNIGSRQQGRLRAENVIDAEYDATDIYQAVKTCLFDEAFRQICFNCSNPYGLGDAGIKIANILATVPLNHDLIRKGMTLKGQARDGWYS